MKSIDDPITHFAMLRQAEDESLNDRWLQGRHVIPLSDEGRKKAMEWGRILRHFKWDRIITADQGRLKETASLVNLSLDIPISYDSRFQEQDWGEWTGKTLIQVLEERPGRLKKQDLIGWRFKPPKGEDLMSVLRRSLLAIKETHMKYRRENILIVTHERVIRSVILHLLEEIKTKTETPVIFLSNHLHWLSCYHRIELMKLNALPLP